MLFWEIHQVFEPLLLVFFSLYLILKLFPYVPFLFNFFFPSLWNMLSVFNNFNILRCQYTAFFNWTKFYRRSHIKNLRKFIFNLLKINTCFLFAAFFFNIITKIVLVFMQFPAIFISMPAILAKGAILRRPIYRSCW